MNVFIMGAGQVGAHLAKVMAEEGHGVTLIESDPRRVEDVDFHLDVRVVAGSGTSSGLLRELDIGSADLFVATSGHDEANLVAASLAKKLGAKKTVARVGQYTYFHEALELAGAFHVDHILSPQELTARQAIAYLEHPGLVMLDDFAGGLIQAFSFHLDEASPLRGPIARLKLPEHTLVGLIRRGAETIIPRGDDALEPGDQVTFIGKAHKGQIFEELVKKKLDRLHTVTIAGASSVGLFIAQKLGRYRFTVKLVERDRERCEEAARLLEHTEVIHSDVTSLDAMKEERLDASSVFIAATDKDDRNILAALLAKELGVPHCLAVVRQPDFSVLISRLGVNHALIPRVIFATHLLELTKAQGCQSRTVLEEEQAEILEFIAREGQPATGQPLASAGFPRGSLVAAIARRGKVFIAGGADRIEPKDRVVIIAKKSVAADVVRMFPSAN